MIPRAFALALLSLPLSGCLTAAALHLAAEERETARLRVFDPAEHAWAQAPGGPVSGHVRRDGGPDLRRPSRPPDPRHAAHALAGRMDRPAEGRGARLLVRRLRHPRRRLDLACRVRRLGPRDPLRRRRYLRLRRCPRRTVSGDAEVDPPAWYASTITADWVVKPVTVSGSAPIAVELGSTSWLSQFEPPQRR